MCLTRQFWQRYCTAAQPGRVTAQLLTATVSTRFSAKLTKLGFYADISNTIMNRFDAADDAFFFGRIINNLLTDNSFIIRMLYKNCY